MKNTLDALISLGFKPEDAEKQINELNNVIPDLVVQRISSENPDTQLNEQNFQEFVESKYSKEGYQKLFAEVAGETVKGYFDAVTKDLSPQKRQAFYDQVKQDFAQS